MRPEAGGHSGRRHATRTHRRDCALAQRRTRGATCDPITRVAALCSCHGWHTRTRGALDRVRVRCSPLVCGGRSGGRRSSLILGRAASSERPPSLTSSGRRPANAMLATHEGEGKSDHMMEGGRRHTGLVVWVTIMQGGQRTCTRDKRGAHLTPCDSRLLKPNQSRDLDKGVSFSHLCPL